MIGWKEGLKDDACTPIWSMPKRLPCVWRREHLDLP